MRVFIGNLLPLLVLCLGSVVFAAETPAQKAERELLSREEEAVRNMDGDAISPLKSFDARGKLYLYPPGEAAAETGVIGTFSAAQRVFLVKLESPDVLQKIQPFNNKEVMLTGKLRAEGKYFIVSGLGGGGAPPVQKTNRKRI